MLQGWLYVAGLTPVARLLAGHAISWETNLGRERSIEDVSDQSKKRYQMIARRAGKPSSQLIFLPSSGLRPA